MSLATGSLNTALFPDEVISFAGVRVRQRKAVSLAQKKLFGDAEARFGSFPIYVKGGRDNNYMQLFVSSDFRLLSFSVVGQTKVEIAKERSGSVH